MATRECTPGLAWPALPAVLWRFLCVLAGLTLACLGSETLCRFLHLPYPYNWPLFNPQDRFADLTIYQARFAFFHSPRFFQQAGWPYMYPAPLALVYRFFYLFAHPVRSFLMLLAASLLCAAALLAQAMRVRGLSRRCVMTLLTAALACSYPFAFEAQQANLEWVVWLAVAGGVWAFVRGRGYGSAACFGVAGAMKIFPLIFLGLFLARRQYRQAAVCLLVSAAATLVTLWTLCPQMATSWHGVQQGLGAFRTMYMLRSSALGVDHSLFAVLKAVLAITHRGTPELVERLLNVYLWLAALAGTAVYFTIIRRLPIVNQVICLSVASILLPPVSYDYTLIHLYAPWALLVLAVLERRERTAGAGAAMFCFALLFAPESELILHHLRFSAQVKAMALCALFLISLHYRFPSSFDVDPNSVPETDSFGRSRASRSKGEPILV